MMSFEDFQRIASLQNAVIELQEAVNELLERVDKLEKASASTLPTEDKVMRRM